jgi:hypothetical protein
VKVNLYTKVWNEEEMLPFFFRHYDPLVERYIVYDDGSTDGTLGMLASHDRVEVRPFVRTDSTSLVLSSQFLNNSMWKDSRRRADWVIITSIDEHLYHPIGLKWYLWAAKLRGITAIPAIAFQMFADSFPSPTEHLTKTRLIGAPLDHYNKLNVFDPNALDETNFAVGRHTAELEGRIRYPRRDQLLLLHYKFLGREYLHRRYAQLDDRRGASDKRNRWGYQYGLKGEALDAEFEELRRTAMNVTGASARNLVRKKWWRSD